MKEGFKMGAWDLEERIEKLRIKMVESALLLGIGHPAVYKLSVELDNLHNEWQKNWQQSKQERNYMRARPKHQVTESLDEKYRTVV
jgi:hypothetical protein